MANECATLNPECMMKNGIKCPAFEAGKNCWEYDWMPMFQNMPQAGKGAGKPVHGAEVSPVPRFP